MIIITTSEERLKKSKYYNKECWDYPIEELLYLLEQENNKENKVFVLTDKNRIYETTYIWEQDIGGLL